MKTLKCAVLAIAAVALVATGCASGGSTTAAAKQPTQVVAQQPAAASAKKPMAVAQAASPTTEKLSDLLKKRVPKDVPVLEDIVVTPPDPSIPSKLAEYSGAWVGSWRGERTYAYMADQLLVFEKVSLASVTVVSGGVGRFAGGYGGYWDNYGQTWSSRSDFRLERETPPLVVTAKNGNKITFRIEKGKLLARSEAPNGDAWIGTFEKITR